MVIWDKDIYLMQLIDKCVKLKCELVIVKYRRGSEICLMKKK